MPVDEDDLPTLPCIVTDPPSDPGVPRGFDDLQLVLDLGEVLELAALPTWARRVIHRAIDKLTPS